MTTPSDTPKIARLRVQCPDRPGIVAAVSTFLFSHGANIVQADQYSTNGGEGRFFLRVEFQTEGLDAPVEEVGALAEKAKSALGGKAAS